MKLEIQANGIPAHREVHHFVRCRADLALKVLRDQIGLVSVFVDNNGQADDGDGIRCLVLIRLSTQPDVVVERSDANLYIAIHRALDQAGWTLSRSLMRRQSSLLQRQLGFIEGLPVDSKPYDPADSVRAA